jgi:toxin ParE1/3/4
VKPVRLDALAEKDVAEAFSWYETREAGLGDRFLADLARTLERIEQAPEACSPVEGRFAAMVRSAPVGRLPYRVVFIELADRSRAVAVAHTRRDPDHLRARLREGGT